MQSFLQNDVKEQNRYSIDIYGLENKSYEYDYEVEPVFFQEMPQDLIEGGNFKVHLVLEKSSTMIQLRFSIVGEVELICDRSLEPYEEQVETQGLMILKFGDQDEELTEEIAIINRNRTRINVAGYIFEFIALALPMKKIHPDLRTQDDDTEFEALVYSSESGETADADESAPAPEEKIDPRWEPLKKLKK
ncbi:YceD family protein [Arundinibacter roseus]|uniref:YceD family protein n=1 Tax=Arundinibacter roseus TaxID=2070510 RepID=UPI001E35596F|nr:DUF177 domain-containing protein [Arundinibacter roseus]